MCSILCYCSADVDIPALQEALSETSSRGPDDSRIVNTGEGWIGFNRLSIMGITGDGMQPFVFRNRTSCRVSELTDTPEGYRIPPDTEIVLACNGEIYGFRPVKEELEKKGYRFISDSDCEILPALYKEYGTDMFRMLDAEFAMVFYDRTPPSVLWNRLRRDLCICLRAEEPDFSCRKRQAVSSGMLFQGWEIYTLPGYVGGEIIQQRRIRADRGKYT